MTTILEPEIPSPAIGSPYPACFPEPWAAEWGEDEFGLWNALIYRGIRQVFRWIPPGRFLMGSAGTEPERSSEETQHEVVLTQGYWLADTASTQALWQAVTGENPSGFSDDPENPVERVSWNDVQTFLSRLNGDATELNARLPTEAEWEYACRAGTTTPFSFGRNITPEQVNFEGNFPYAGGKKGLYRERTVPVGSLPANPWGLYEMHGNVWEWCQDWYGDYSAALATDPMGPDTGALRVLRGGSWLGSGRLARSSFRLGLGPDSRYGSFGFRLALGQSGR